MFGGILVGFLEILESNIVIDNSIVKNLREQIFIENLLLSDQQRSRILIEKIHHNINRSLSGISTDFHRQMRQLILNRSVKDGGILITYSDVIHSLAEINIPLVNAIENVENWYRENLIDSDISLDNLIDYLKVIHFYEPPVEVHDEVQLHMTDEANTLLDVDEIEIEDTHEAHHIPDEPLNVKQELFEANILVDTSPTEEPANSKSRKWSLGLLVFILLAVIIYFSTAHTDSALTEKSIEPVKVYQPLSFMEAQALYDLKTSEHGLFNESIKFHTTIEESGIPHFLTYHAIDRIALQNYLKNRNSILAESPYFEGIIKVAETYDIHPLLLFSITGQEQGYVNKDNPNHLKIANNPFNVYTSWRKYNTDIEDSTSIAAGTVVTILRKRPAGENPFKWINKRYAEDQNWARGVEMIFNFLLQYEL